MKKPLLYPKLAWQGIRKNAETYNDSLFYGIGIGCYVVFAVIYALMYLLTSRRYYRIVR